MKPSPVRIESSSVRPTKILIVDDHELVQEGLAALIRSQTDLQLCGVSGCMYEAKRMIESEGPELVIVDLRLPDASGLILLQWITEQRPKVRVIVSSMYDEEQYGGRVLRLGAMGYVNKSSSGQLILKAIRRVMDGKLFFSEELTEQLLRESSCRATEKSAVALLTDRELEILTLLGQGMTTQEISQKLFLSRNTIGTYRERLKSKLKLKNSVELIYFAVCWAEGETAP